MLQYGTFKVGPGDLRPLQARKLTERALWLLVLGCIMLVLWHSTQKEYPFVVSIMLLIFAYLSWSKAMTIRDDVRQSLYQYVERLGFKEMKLISSTTTIYAAILNGEKVMVTLVFKEDRVSVFMDPLE